MLRKLLSDHFRVHSLLVFVIQMTVVTALISTVGFFFPSSSDVLL